jgi:tRNA pseudouridine38-40 synthase
MSDNRIKDSDFLLMKNIRLDVEYDGTGFYGWQRQSDVQPTVQGTVEAVLSRILQENVVVTASGRTDRGVHARLQVLNFMTGSLMELSRMSHALNCLLPVTIRVSGLQVVPPDFHARFSAKEREYRYMLLETPSALRQRFTGCSHGHLDLAPMRVSAASLCGVHDFRAFSREPADRSSFICNVMICEWFRENGALVFRIRANRFLRSMVRCLVGAMIATGKGLLQPSEIVNALETGRLSGQLVPAEPSGLFLWDVLY